MRKFYVIILVFFIIPGILSAHPLGDGELSEVPESSAEPVKISYTDFIAPTADCVPLAEFTEDFNSTEEGEVPDCWNTMRMNSSSGNVDLNVKSNPNAITPPHDFQFNNSTDDNAIFYLVTPELSTLADGTHRLRFYYDKNGNDNVQVEVGTMSNATSANTFTSIASISPGEGYNVYIVDFDQPTTDSYVAFKLSFSIGFSRVYLDNVSWEPILDCVEPTDLSFDSSGETTADLSWSPGEEESNWTVKYGEQGFDFQTEGLTEEVSGLPEVTLTDLAVNTMYQAYIKSNCADDEESVYAGPINFYTGYCPGNAEGGSGSIDDFTTTGGYENIDNQDTGEENGYEDYTDMIVSQLPGSSFDFSANTTGSSAGFAIYIDYNQDFEFDSSEKVYTSNGYETEVSGTISIPEDTTPGEYRLRVVSNWLSMDPEPCDHGNQGKIQDYTLEVLPISECTPPENLSLESVGVNTADINWTAGADETQWEVKYGEPGFDPDDDEGSSQIVNDDPQTTLTDLSSNTTYEIYLRALCENSDSMFTPPLQFTTACEATDIPFVQDFEDTTPPAIPDCGIIENAGSGNNWETHHLTYYGFDSNVLRYKYSENPANAWYFTRGIALEEGTNYQLIYKFGNNANTMSEKLRVSYGTAPESSAMDTELANHTNVVGQEAEIDEILFTVEEDGVYYFGFNAHSDADQFYLFVDDIEIDLAPTCPKPTQIEIDYIADTYAHISWTPGTDETAWEVIYGEEGFDPDGDEGTSIEVENQDPQTVLDNLDPDSSYDIYVKAICTEDDESEWSNSNTFATKPVSPENNYLCDAFELEVDATCTETYSNVDAFEEIDEPVGSCLNVFHGTNSVWFSFTAPENGDVLITSDFESTSFNTEMVVYDAPENCEDLSTLGEEIGCADSGADLELQDLTPGEVYYIKLAGFNNEEGEFCIEVQTDETPSCPAPTDINIGEITEDTVEVSWTAGGNESQWEVIYGEAGFNPETAGESEVVNTTEVTLTELSPETDYEVYVRAICTNLNSDLAGPETFTTDEMSVDSHIFADFTFYPNPVKDQLILKAGSQIKSVEVYNLLGQSVISAQPNSLEAQINTEKLQSGVYLMNVTIYGSQKTFRIVKK